MRHRTAGAVWVIAALAIPSALADDLRSFQQIPPGDVEYKGEAVPTVYPWLHASLPWRGETFWLTDDGLYRTKTDGRIIRYDPTVLTEQVMGQDVKLPKDRTRMRKVLNAVVVEDTMWIASDAFGLLQFYPDKDRWNRFDTTERAMPGKHLWVLFADDAYVFAGAGRGVDLPALNVFSARANRWVALAQIPQDYIRSLGRMTAPAWRPARLEGEALLRGGMYEVPSAFGVQISVEYGTYLYQDPRTIPETVILLPRAYLAGLFGLTSERSYARRDVPLDEIFTVKELRAQPEAFAGHVVVVRALYVHGTAGQFLYDVVSTSYPPSRDRNDTMLLVGAMPQDVVRAAEWSVAPTPPTLWRVVEVTARVHLGPRGREPYLEVLDAHALRPEETQRQVIDQ